MSMLRRVADELSHVGAFADEQERAGSTRETVLEQQARAYEEYQDFFAARITGPKVRAFLARASKAKKIANLEKNGKLLNYRNLDTRNKTLVDDARRKEWDNYLKFNAVKVITLDEANEIRDTTGAEELPMKWVDVDKHDFLRLQGGARVEPKMKSRLVGRRDLSVCFG